ncbi:MAG: TrkA family potassium uptake protein, partial [Microcystis sp.]
MVTTAKSIVVRMCDREFLEAYRLARASHIISTIDLAVATMANAIEYPEVESMMHFEQGQVEVPAILILKSNK